MITEVITVEETLRLLEEYYGPRPWRPRADPLSELMRTILSQNTSDANSHRAYDSLLSAFGSWEAVAKADVGAIAQAIWQGGLARIKAARIKEILSLIEERRGALDLSFLQDVPLVEAKAWLRGLPGVGPKTAACVLLFSLGRPAFPVDTHVHRVAKRLGLIAERASAEVAHGLLEGMVAPQDVYALHMLMVEHGRQLCRAQRPLCPQCPLRHGCRYYCEGKAQATSGQEFRRALS